MVPPPPRPPVICYDLAERARVNRQRHSSLRDEIDKAVNKVNSLKKSQDRLIMTSGLSHNAARYIQKLEDDYAKLQQQYNILLAASQRQSLQRSSPPPQGKSIPRTPLRPTQQRTQISPQRSSPTISISSSFGKSPPITSSDEETIDVTDVRFFEKIEDATMMEVENLMRRIKEI